MHVDRTFSHYFKVFYSLHVMCVCVCYSKTIVLCLTSFTTLVKNARLKWHEY